MGLSLVDDWGAVNRGPGCLAVTSALYAAERRFAWRLIGVDRHERFCRRDLKVGRFGSGFSVEGRGVSVSLDAAFGVTEVASELSLAPAPVALGSSVDVGECGGTDFSVAGPACDLKRGIGYNESYTSGKTKEN